ncbi:MAG: hypothetical protein ACE37B_06345 [Ilumatobacter sp.]|jgi:hypothetical protein|uniref:hypothetical protein n=1 Tax=Ilumatobacter sp. TaxID=1967498 RepID=UPI00391CB6D0
MDAIFWTILGLSVIALIAIGFVAFRARQRAGSVIASTGTSEPTTDTPARPHDPASPETPPQHRRSRP